MKLCNIVDERTREALTMGVGRSCTADDVVAIIERLVAQRGAPEHLRVDNGPELVAWGLSDWCRRHHTTKAPVGVRAYLRDALRPDRVQAEESESARWLVKWGL